MTGIEQLRKIGADAVRGGEVGRALCDIADQIERETYDAAEVRKDAERALCVELDAPIDEGADPLDVLRRHVEGLNDTIENLRLELGEARDPAADVSMSAYDLLPPDERDAIAWVREHGGLERVNRERENLYGVLRETCDLLDVSYFGVWTTDAQSIWRKFDWYKARLGESVPRSYAKRRIAARQRQIDESHAALRRRNARIVELEQECDELREMVRSLNALTDEMEKRLMPEGMEWLVDTWPRFEDDAPVRFGDMALIDGAADMVEAVQLWVHGKPVIYGDGGSQQLEKGERIKRPAPKVLDADGAEIEVGDDLYSVEGMLKFHVSAIDKKSGRIATEAMFALDKWADPKMYTHRAPVLAADGRPLREGETVWHEDGTELRVLGFLHEEGDETLVKVERVSGPTDWCECLSLSLTHERPRDKCRDCRHWQKDPESGSLGVCWFLYHEYGGEDCYAARSGGRDACEEFVPSARALAGDA